MAKRWSIRLRRALACALLAAAPATAAPRCEVGTILELPVAIVGDRAIVTARIGTRPARFIVDSGAFQSTLSQGAVADNKLIPMLADPRFRMQGANGDANATVVRVPQFTLGGMSVPQALFIVGGSEVGWDGLLGQNILGQYDVDYDFPHGMIRLVRVKGCSGSGAATWAGDRPVAQLSLIPRRPPQTAHIQGNVLLNGRPLQAIFDTGAPSSILTLTAARRLGVTPQSPGVEQTDHSGGVGLEQVPTWIGRFDQLSIADEEIAHPSLRFAAVNLGGVDMLIGFDFFRSHRVLVLNSRARMLFTRETPP